MRYLIIMFLGYGCSCLSQSDSSLALGQSHVSQVIEVAPEPIDGIQVYKDWLI